MTIWPWVPFHKHDQPWSDHGQLVVRPWSVMVSDHGQMMVDHGLTANMSQGME